MDEPFDTPAKPPRARVEDAPLPETAGAKLERKRELEHQIG